MTAEEVCPPLQRTEGVTGRQRESEEGEARRPAPLTLEGRSPSFGLGSHTVNTWHSDAV